jgi:PAS domain S-box-containing protein
MNESQLLRALLDASPDVIFVKDIDGAYLMCNRAFETYAGLPEQEVIGRKDGQIFPAAMGDVLRMQDIRVMEKGEIHRTEWVTYPGDGPQLLDMLSVPLYDSARNITGILGIGRDVTSHRRLEHRLVSATEERQRTIGQELHDNLGQRLVGISFLGKTLEQLLATEKPALAQQAALIVTQAGEAAAEVRALSRNLVPVEIESNGLMSALDALANRTACTYDVVCRFHAVDEVLVFDQAQALNLYRIAQEASNNAIRHGRAKNIDILLAHAENSIILTVEDNGSGLSPQAQECQGMGLHIMRYRASLAGGRLNIETASGGGVRVQAVIPEKPAILTIERRRAP